MIKLHLGCGTNKLPGWINIDAVKDCRPDVVHDISSPLPYGDLTVDEILAEDLLEHFDKYARYIVFEQWVRVLKVGGKITLQVPNFKKILFKYFKFGFDNFVDFIFGENMLRSEVYLGHFGNHKWGYSEKSLQEFVKVFGIEPLKVKTVGLNIRLLGEKKRHVSQEELDKVEIYSHANAHGTGDPTMSLKLTMEKVEAFRKNTEHQYEHTG
jgi:hypothetical protein